MPANICVVGEGTTDQAQLIFHALDPLKGKGREFTRIDADPKADWYYWDIAPDGSRIAIIIRRRSKGHIRAVALGGAPGDRAVRDVILPGWPGWRHHYWSSDGKGWYTFASRGSFFPLSTWRGR